jgi:hypothetical protein
MKVSGQCHSPEAAISPGPRLDDAHCHSARSDEQDNHSSCLASKSAGQHLLTHILPVHF